MTIFRTVLFTFFLANAPALAQTIVPASAPCANTLLDAVRTAHDPSAAVEAYACGLAARTLAPIELQKAYVHRMSGLGAPEFADAQAHELIDRSAADATSRGVAAYNDATRGDAHAAIVNLKLALADRVDDPFLLRTAGQVVAWYDSLDGRASLSNYDVAGIESLRSAGLARQVFADAYHAAQTARQQLTAGKTAAGHTTAGHATAGRTTGGYTTDEKTTAGQVIAGQATAGHAMSGQTTHGQMTAGEVTSGYTNAGRTTEGRLTSGRVTGGEVTGGRVTGGQITGGM